MLSCFPFFRDMYNQHNFVGDVPLGKLLMSAKPWRKTVPLVGSTGTSLMNAERKTGRSSTGNVPESHV